MGSDRPTLPMVLVILRQPERAHSVALALEELRFPYRLASLEALGWPRGDSAAVYCLAAEEARELGRLPVPSVLLSPGTGWRGTRADLALDSALLPMPDLGPASLLRALVAAALGTHADFVARHLAGTKMFAELPLELLNAFLREPTGMKRLSDIRCSLKLSRSRAHALVRYTQRFERAEHLLAALRCASWAVLISQDLARSPVEEYLGITDRAAFRRACHRADVAAPHRGMNLSAFCR